MTFVQGFKFVHRESWAFLLACPLVALIPVIAELAQHIAEMQAGMYNGLEGAQAAESDPQRMAFGFVKTLAISLIGYSGVRFFASAGDAAYARRLEPRALQLFAIVFALQALLSYVTLFALPASAGFMIGFFLFFLVLSPLLVRFLVAAPLGVLITPQASAAQMWRQLPWAVAFGLLAPLPLMALHYALSIGAMLAAGDALKWVMLVVDALVVGWLAAVLSAVSWVIATRKAPPDELARTALT